MVAGLCESSHELVKTSNEFLSDSFRPRYPGRFVVEEVLIHFGKKIFKGVAFHDTYLDALINIISCNLVLNADLLEEVDYLEVLLLLLLEVIKLGRIGIKTDLFGLLVEPYEELDLFSLVHEVSNPEVVLCLPYLLTLKIALELVYHPEESVILFVFLQLSGKSYLL